MKNEPDCPFRKYEEEKLNWLQTQLSSAEGVWNEDMTNLSWTEDISKGTQLTTQVQNIKEASEKSQQPLLTQLNSGHKSNCFLN